MPTFTTRRSAWPIAAAWALSMSIFGLTAPTAEASAPRTLYVSAAAQPGGIGSQSRPFNSLHGAEQASVAGDTIVVMASPAAVAPLDGGITLKAGQHLLGQGPDVRNLSATAAAPRITNSTGAQHNGDAVTLADGATVTNLRIPNAFRGAVYGEDISEVAIIGNDVSGQNTSCTNGFLIPEFNAPTNLPGIGVPISGGLQNGWAGIMVDADSRNGGTVNITNNLVHDAKCGDGIDIRVSGTASYRASITGNAMHSLRQGSALKSVLAIGLQARDHSRLTASVNDNTQSNLGNDDDPNLLVAGADSEGVFVNGVGPATMDVSVNRNTYTNERGLGGFSANGLEMVTMGDGSHVTLRVRDSHFSGSPGDVIEEGALGTNATLDLTLERVTAERSTGIGNSAIFPFNNGDCLLAGSLGARNSILLTVRDSILRDCSNNGLALGSNVVNGTGPSTEIRADIRNTRISGNRAGNLGIRNFTALDKLSVRVEGSTLLANKSFGSAIGNFSAENLGTTSQSRIDFGGGSLGSAGGNCIVGGLLAADVVRYDVSARRNWWGQAGGPGLLRTMVVGGKLDTGSPLNAAPAGCS